MAIVIASSLPRWPTRTVLHFCFDAHIAGYTAAGVWSPSHHLHQQGLIRSFIHWLEHHFYRIQWDHVPAHTVEPWNEAADTLAYEAAHRLIEVVDITPWLHALDGDAAAIEWYWFLCQPRLPGQLPWLQGKCHSLLPLPQLMDPCADHHPIAQHQPPKDTPALENLEVLFGTANVLTFFQKEMGKGRLEHSVQLEWRISFCSSMSRTMCWSALRKLAPSLRVI